MPVALEKVPAKEVSELRRRTGLTQARICQLVGVQPATWSRWENGHHSPNRVHWNRLLRILADELPHLEGARPSRDKHGWALLLESTSLQRKYGITEPELSEIVTVAPDVLLEGFSLNEVLIFLWGYRMGKTRLEGDA